MSSRVSRRNCCRNRTVTSGSSSTIRMLTGMGLNSSRRIKRAFAEAARQTDGEFGELPDNAGDLDRPAMLFGDDFIADRQPEAGTLAGGLRAEKRLEELFPDLSRNAASVVAHPHFDCLAEIACGHHQFRSEFPIAGFSPALIRGVEGVTEEIEEHSRHVLRHKRDRRHILAVGSL